MGISRDGNLVLGFRNIEGGEKRATHEDAAEESGGGGQIVKKCIAMVLRSHKVGNDMVLEELVLNESLRYTLYELLEETTVWEIYRFKSMNFQIREPRNSISPTLYHPTSPFLQEILIHNLFQLLNH